jgi:uncharacterized membrane protein YcaP (DUF421 family)
MPPNVRVFDFKRIFIGDVPWTFTLEIAFRTTLMYLYALLLIRFIGKRGLRELSVFEYVIIFTLGSAIGDPMFYPEIPLLHGMAVLTVIVGLQRGMVWMVQRSRRFHDFVYPGDAASLVMDGLINRDGLVRERLNVKDLAMLLRESGVEHLGQVRRAFLEPTGELSVWKVPQDQIRPGLPIMPDSDPERPPTIASRAAPQSGYYACEACGTVVRFSEGEAVTKCSRCGHTGWMRAG